MLCENCSQPSRPHYSLGTEVELLAQLRSSPTPSSLTEISAKIQEVETGLKHYDAEIIRLQSELASLMASAGVLRKRLMLARGMFSPVRRLPDEVLSRIFTYAHQGTFSFTESCKAPAFASVCARWRSVALSSPSVWAYLKVEVGSKHNYSHPRTNMAALETHLARSKSHPLSIIFMFVSTIDMPNPAVGVGSEEMADALIRHSSRWVYLAFLGVYSTFPDLPVFQQLEAITQFPLLETLTSKVYIPDPLLAAILRQSPQLRDLAVVKSPLLSNEAHLNRITNLQISVYRTANVFGVTQYFPDVLNLAYTLDHRKALKNDIMSTVPGFVIPPPPLVRAKKLLLRLYGDIVQSGYNMLPYLMSSLSLPSLENLIITSGEADPFKGVLSTDPVTSFLLRSQCSVKILRIERISVSDIDMISLLRHLPALTELTVQETHTVASPMPITTKFLQRLHSYNSGDVFVPCLVPKLQRFSFTVHGETLDERVFVEMVLSRCIADESLGVERLRSIELVVNKHIDKTVWQGLQAKGLVVKLKEDLKVEADV